MTPPRVVSLSGALFACMATACGGSSPAAPGAGACQPTLGPTTELRVGDVFRVRFTVPPGQTNDMVLFTYLGMASGLGSARLVHQLHDGGTLLGEQQIQDSVAVWKSAESSYGTPGDTRYGLSSPALVVDFRSIVSGTLDGRAELRVTNGSALLERPELATVFLIGPAPGGFPERYASIAAREVCR